MLRSVWFEFDVQLAERERIVERYERLTSSGCSARVALRAALDEWANRMVNAERALGLSSGYLYGPHWDRITKLSRLLADERCEGWACHRRDGLQHHHHHYDSVGWESLFAVSLVCDDCHRRITYQWSFEREISERRKREIAERDLALASIGEAPPPDDVERKWPPQSIDTGS